MLKILNPPDLAESASTETYPSAMVNLWGVDEEYVIVPLP
jgi:hypothetical protein